LDLEHPIARLDLLEGVLEKMLERLLSDLPAGYGVGRLHGRLSNEGEIPEPTEWEIELCRPSASATHWRKLLHLRLERVRLQAPATRLHLWGGSILRLDQRQEELFPDAQLERLDARVDLLDRLSSRLGRDRVLRPRLVADAQPELACRYEPVARVFPKRKSAPSSEPAAWRPPAPRPLFLQFAPEPLTATSVAPDGPPIRLWLGRPPVESLVARSWGPERIETGWHRGRPIRRDYYRVETTSGQRLWIFRSLDDGRWFLHGWF
jgi:protein ImuB